MEKSSSRILVADSFEPWRSYVRSTVEKYEDLQIVGEASDGLESVQKAAELKPDLVLLSVGLPKLNESKRQRQYAKRFPA